MLRLTIDASFKNDLYFATIELDDVVVVANGLELAMDSRTAQRANGLKIDFVAAVSGAGFKIENPNERSVVKGIHPADLVRSLEKREKLHFIDLRSEAEHAKAKLGAARRLDEAYQRELDALTKDTKLVFLAHHSSGAQATAHAFYDRGFHNVWYVVGGIDAWATMDPDVPRY